jgi:hypothetical protein
MVTFLTFALTAAAYAEPKLVPGSAAITGRINASKGCTGEAQIWISRDSLLLYQAAAMPGASFEFHVMPGPIDVNVTSEAGCIASATARLKANRIENLELALTRPSAVKGRSPAGMGFCPNCGMIGAGGFSTGWVPSPMIMPVGGPWWYPSTMMFTPPSPWLMGPMFPGNGAAWMHGGGAMGKPNVYISAPAGTHVRVSVEAQPGTNLLGAVPAHDTGGWEAEVRAPYSLATDGALLGYLFYDYRFNPQSLQTTDGFCAAREDLIPRLVAELRRAGFEEYELKDFASYWTYKMPYADSYCVYPQDERQLAPIAKLKITPTPASVTRVGFMVVPQTPGWRPPIMASKPAREWTPHYIAANGQVMPFEATRQPAASGKHAITIREWGVGFLRGAN